MTQGRGATVRFPLVAVNDRLPYAVRFMRNPTVTLR